MRAGLLSLLAGFAVEAHIIMVPNSINSTTLITHTHSHTQYSVINTSDILPTTSPADDTTHPGVYFATPANHVPAKALLSSTQKKRVVRRCTKSSPPTVTSTLTPTPTVTIIPVSTGPSSFTGTTTIAVFENGSTAMMTLTGIFAAPQSTPSSVHSSLTATETYTLVLEGHTITQVVTGTFEATDTPTTSGAATTTTTTSATATPASTTITTGTTTMTTTTTMPNATTTTPVSTTFTTLSTSATTATDTQIFCDVLDDPNDCNTKGGRLNMHLPTEGVAPV
ncbi:hypothetical protein F5Y08DRAFT_352687 [Xylaria arbuscula]|nr:hypothetical protein F5Y08DRAFT_352687 [Xylaria arbuscula]